MKSLFFFLSVVVLAASCSVPKNTQAVSRTIECGPGPEDMELDSSAGKPRLIISCNQRRKSNKKHTYPAIGEIMEYVFDGKPAVIIPRTGGPTGTQFNPHGFSIATVSGKRLLYVINHAKLDGNKRENRIEVYELKGSQLIHQKTITGPELVSPNDCFANTAGEVFFTNDSGGKNYLWEKLWRLKKSTVYCIKSDGSKVKVADKMAYANGIIQVCCDTVLSPSLENPEQIKEIIHPALIVTTVQQKSMFRYHATAFTRKNIMPVFGQDNVMRCGDELVVACHPKPVKFLKHAINAEKHSPTHVWAYNLKTGIYRLVFVDDGSRVSTGSTAILYKGKLYVSQVFQPYILQVDMNTVTP